MAGTRSSTRSAKDGSPHQDDAATGGTKRKAEEKTSPQAKRGKKATPKKQATLEETLDKDQENDTPKDIEMKEAAAEGEGTEKKASEQQQQPTKELDNETAAEASNGEAKQEEKDDEKIDGQRTSKTDAKPESDANGAIEKSSQRGQDMPSNILEKGIIYFFTRNRVNIDDAESVGDLARTYFVLRPIAADAKLGDGAIQDLKNNRLFALPKKVFPKSHSDRFMAFVEKAKTSIQDLKDNFFGGTEYATQTSGTRRTEPVAPVGEGVYAITRTEDRTTHLAYMLTIPSEPGEVQEELGLKNQGSFIISVKNPERSGPANASLPEKPDWPNEFIEEFRGLAWSEVKPKYLDYPNVQILLIGEDIAKAVEPTSKDKKHDKETPMEEMEKLEHEDELRVEHLHGDDSVFDDLQISKKNYSQVPTTW